jgi:hypothetical protein
MHEEPERLLLLGSLVAGDSVPRNGGSGLASW